MDLTRNDDKQSQKKLDLEFQRILRIIKPYIPCIMNNRYLTLYRMWLEKLSELGVQEKEERNHYLIELCHQIQDGILLKPFIHSPPVGPLPPLKNYLQNKEIRQHHAQELKTLRQSLWQNNKFLKNKSKTIELPPSIEIPTESYKKRNRYTILKNIQNQNSVQHNIIDDVLVELPKQVHPTHFLSESNVYPEKVASKNIQSLFRNSSKWPQTHNFADRHCLNTRTQCINDRNNNNNNNNNKRKLFCQQYMFRPPIQKVLENTFCLQQKLKQDKTFVNIENNKQDKDKDDDSSWCDLTDVSSSTESKLGSGDVSDNASPILNYSKPDNQNNLYKVYEVRIAELMNVIAELQKQNLSLNEDVAKYERDLSLRNVKAETCINNLAGEMKSLKSGLQELTEIKTSLKKSNFNASSQLQSTLNSLNKELYVTQNQNLALKAEIIDLKKKLEELSTQKQKDTASLKQKLSDTHAKEINVLKETHVKQVKSIEEKFTKILTETENAFRQKQKDLKNYYEKKILDIISDYDKTINNRNLEIQRLEGTIEKQYKRMHEEVREIPRQIEDHSNVIEDTNLEKIALLQKCFWKMDHLFKKSHKKYNKQIAKLKQEIEIKDKAVQIQLTTQRAELIASTNTKRQAETDATVLLLEDRYKKLLEMQHAHFLSQKQNDAKLIYTLRAILTKNNVTV